MKYQFFNQILMFLFQYVDRYLTEKMEEVTPQRRKNKCPARRSQMNKKMNRLRGRARQLFMAYCDENCVVPEDCDVPENCDVPDSDTLSFSVSPSRSNPLQDITNVGVPTVSSSTDVRGASRSDIFNNRRQTSQHPRLGSRITFDVTDWQYRETPFGMTLIADNGVMVIPPGMIDSLILENHNLLESKFMFSALL